MHKQRGMLSFYLMLVFTVILALHMQVQSAQVRFYKMIKLDKDKVKIEGGSFFYVGKALTQLWLGNLAAGDCQIIPPCERPGKWWFLEGNNLVPDDEVYYYLEKIYECYNLDKRPLMRLTIALHGEKLGVVKIVELVLDKSDMSIIFERHRYVAL